MRERWIGAGIGLVAGAVAIGIGTLVGAWVDASSAPITVVGAAAIDATPEWLKSFAIRTFGEQDKTVLLAGIGLTLAALAVVIGIASMRRRWVGFVGLIALGAIGVAAALTRPGAVPPDAVPAIAGAAAGLVAFVVLRRAAGLDDAPEPATGVEHDIDRRRVLVAGGTLLGVAVLAGAVGRSIMRQASSAVDAARVAIGVPAVASPAPAIPAGAELGVAGVTPFITPNADFYRVDTALTVPSLEVEGWALTIGGMVDRPLTVTYEQILDRPLIERDITLTCISNEVGGRYLGNARWIGISLKDLLDEAGVQTGVDQMVSHSSDGFTTGTPASIALDGRDAMLAIAMNGEPLPLAHGFPVRMVIPGLYGYESACKWITEIELTTYQAFSAYWVRRGWAEQALIQTSSRIDTPSNGRTLDAGPQMIGGVAWAQHRGIGAVEVRIDAGAWTPATLGEVTTEDTWRQWSAPWTATPGTHTIAVRAIDGDGAVQTDAVAPPFPSGATGLHQITVEVR